MKAKACRICGRVQPYHFCREVAPGATLSCKELRLRQTQEEKKARERKLTATLNSGVELGRSNKELTQRLAPLVLRSYAEVGKIMALSPQSVRMTELKALDKIRKALLPFRNSRSGVDKVRQIQNPIPSLEDR